MFKSMRADAPGCVWAVREPVLFRSVLHERETGVALTNAPHTDPFSTQPGPRLCEKSRGCYDSFFKSAGGSDGCQALWKGLTGAKAHFSQRCLTTTWPRTIWFVRLTLS